MNISLFVVLTALLSSPVAHADLCTDDRAIPGAEESLARSRQAQAIGLSSTYDVLMGEKHVLELKLCKDSHDSTSFKELVQNVLERGGLVERNWKIQLASTEALILVRAEKDALRQACTSQLLKTAQARYKAGLSSKSDLDQITAACALVIR